MLIFATENETKIHKKLKQQTKNSKTMKKDILNKLLELQQEVASNYDTCSEHLKPYYDGEWNGLQQAMIIINKIM